jgi:type IV pilus biogenesis protein CpaD/CtpE
MKGLLGRGLALAGMAAMAAVLGGCSDTLPFSQLPDLTKLPQKVMGKEEQQQKINEMIERGHTHQSEAAKQIEEGK